MSRTHDPENKWLHTVIKEYDHWIAEVSLRQHTFGCYILFAKREIEKFSELKPNELEDLTGAMNELQSTLNKNPLFKPNRYNYLQLGNVLNHLHFHCVPRYKTPREFAGKVWSDKGYGGPPNWTYDEIDKETVELFKKEFEKYL